MTSLLVLGGSGFAGRAIVDEGLDRGWEVTTFNRGRRGDPDPRVHRIAGDREDPVTLRPLAGRDWDLVVDTWSGAPRAVRDSAAVLADRGGRYVYLSTGSVYPPPMAIGVDETEPTVGGDPDAAATNYPEDKRGAELAVSAAFGDRALIARLGLLAGPYDQTNRLTRWLQRMSDGGAVLSPEPKTLPIQYIDVRDLARFVLDAAPGGLAGACNVVSRPGHATMRTLLEACREVAGVADTTLRWASAHEIAAAGLEPWTDLPMWLPPGHAFEGLMGMDVERAHAAGLRCRPIAETVADTWAWMRSELS